MAYNTKYNKGIDWEVISSTQELTQNRKCKGCRHLDQGWHCRYLADMGPGHSRVKLGIKTRPGGGCDAYAPRTHDKTSPRPSIVLPQSAARKMRENAKVNMGKLINNPEAERTALELYQKGAGDTQIANVIGTTRNAVYLWRKAKGLESNYQKFRKETPL